MHPPLPVFTKARMKFRWPTFLLFPGEKQPTKKRLECHFLSDSNSDWRPDPIKQFVPQPLPCEKKPFCTNKKMAVSALFPPRSWKYSSRPSQWTLLFSQPTSRVEQTFFCRVGRSLLVPCRSAVPFCFREREGRRVTLSATSEKASGFFAVSPLLFRVKPLALGGVLQYAAAERNPPEPSQQLLFYKSNCTVEVGLESKVSLRERGLFQTLRGISRFGISVFLNDFFLILDLNIKANSAKRSLWYFEQHYIVS